MTGKKLRGQRVAITGMIQRYDQKGNFQIGTTKYGNGSDLPAVRQFNLLVCVLPWLRSGTNTVRGFVVHPYIIAPSSKVLYKKERGKRDKLRKTSGGVYTPVIKDPGCLSRCPNRLTMVRDAKNVRANFRGDRRSIDGGLVIGGG
jgi:hypothetical protein